MKKRRMSRPWKQGFEDGWVAAIQHLSLNCGMLNGDAKGMTKEELIEAIMAVGRPLSDFE